MEDQWIFHRKEDRFSINKTTKHSFKNASIENIDEVEEMLDDVFV